jgi:hypothetical protein
MAELVSEAEAAIKDGRTANDLLASLTAEAAAIAMLAPALEDIAPPPKQAVQHGSLIGELEKLARLVAGNDLAAIEEAKRLRPFLEGAEDMRHLVPVLIAAFDSLDFRKTGDVVAAMVQASVAN